MRALPLACLVLALVAGGCTSGGSSPSPSGAPTPVPTTGPTPAPTASPATADFSLVVFPAEEPPEIRTAIPGARVCFLVVVEDATGGKVPVAIGASAIGAKVVEIRPAELVPGQVGEVWVIPDAATAETVDRVTITGTRAGVVRAVERSLPVFAMADERASDARPYFERWVAWLADAHPELGITADTEWEPVFVSTLLVVSHYAYYSDEWELSISWHVMIAPHDWSEIYLRRRGTESAPSLAFKVDSWSGNTAPRAVTPPTELVR